MSARIVTPTEAQDLLQRTRVELGRAVVGQQRLLDRVLIALLADGHCLLEGVPGIGKTLTVASLARTLGGSFTRIQFTPDLIPSDIVGTRIYRPSTERFDVELGPIFTNFVLADEINRAPAKVQSALLEVMAERQVSIGGTTYPVPAPFLVLATRHPREHGMSRVEGYLAYGASPRASIGLVRAARAMALLHGRDRAEPQDVYDIAYDVLNHRLVLSFDAIASGVSVDDVLVEVLTTVPAPVPVAVG